MIRHGTVKNGVIVPDTSARLPDGARVRFEVEEVVEYPHPLAPYNREKEVALLRDRIAEQEAGIPGIPLEEAMAQITASLLTQNDTPVATFQVSLVNTPPSPRKLGTLKGSVVHMAADFDAIPEGFEEYTG